MDSVDLISFLRNYYYISNQSLKFNTLSHEDIQILFPDIRTCKHVEVELIKTGDIIGVYDRYNHIVYYNNPHIICDILPEFYNDDYVNDEKVLIDSKIQNLSKDELLKIRRKLRLLGKRKEAYQVNKIIRKRKSEEPHEYRKKKIKLIKESYYD